MVAAEGALAAVNFEETVVAVEGDFAAGAERDGGDDEDDAEGLPALATPAAAIAAAPALAGR